MTYFLFRVFKRAAINGMAGRAGFSTDYLCAVPVGETISLTQVATDLVSAERLLHSSETEFPYVIAYALSDTAPVNGVTATWMLFPPNPDLGFPALVPVGWREPFFPFMFNGLTLLQNRVKGAPYRLEHYDVLTEWDWAPSTKKIRGRWALTLDTDGPTARDWWPLHQFVMHDVQYLCNAAGVDETGKVTATPDAEGPLLLGAITYHAKYDRTLHGPKQAIHKACQDRLGQILDTARDALAVFWHDQPQEDYLYTEASRAQLWAMLQSIIDLCAQWRFFAQVMGYTSDFYNWPVEDGGGIERYFAPAELRGKGQAAANEDLIIDCLNRLLHIEQSTRATATKIQGFYTGVIGGSTGWFFATHQEFELAPLVVAQLFGAVNAINLLHWAWRLKRVDSRKGVAAREGTGRYLDGRGPGPVPVLEGEYDVVPFQGAAYPRNFVYAIQERSDEAIASMPWDRLPVHHANVSHDKGTIQGIADAGGNPFHPEFLPSPAQWGQLHDTLSDWVDKIEEALKPLTFPDIVRDLPGSGI